MAAFLPQAINSVLSQDYPNLEYIVVDGGSRDGTLEILERYGNRLRYVVGQDQGPSDAIHRGFSLATGDIFAWLNADDTYLPGAVKTAVESLMSRPDLDVVYGEGYWIDENGGVISRYPTLPFDAKVLERDCFICQPASFIRACSYRRCGLDPRQNISFDYDLWIRMAKEKFHFAMMPHYLANSRIHSGAKTLKERNDVFLASIALLKRHFGYVPVPWVVGYTAYRIDGRDQVVEPLKLSPVKYLASLPMGLWLNPTTPLRFIGEWLSVACRGALRWTREGDGITPS